MKAEVWNWAKVVVFTPAAIAIVVVTAPILGAFAAYDWVFLGWRCASDVRKGQKK